LSPRRFRRFGRLDAAGLRHALLGEVDPPGQDREFLLHSAEPGAGFGPTLDGAAVVGAGGGELRLNLAEIAIRLLELLVAAQRRVALGAQDSGLAARTDRGIGEETPAGQRGDTERAADEHGFLSPQQQIQHGTPLTPHARRQASGPELRHSVSMPSRG
jgi:hypothetical protein